MEITKKKEMKPKRKLIKIDNQIEHEDGRYCYE